MEKEILLNFPSVSNFLQLRGRYEESDGVINFDNIGSGFNLSFSKSEKITLVLKSVGCSSMLIKIDGTIKYYSLKDEINSIVLFLPYKTNHNLELYKNNEPTCGLLSFLAIKTVSEIVFHKLPNKKYTFDFYGDSITCGNQINNDGSEDGYFAYPRILSDYYNANYKIIAISGKGLMAGYNGCNVSDITKDNQINTLAKYTSFYRNKSLWNFQNNKADVVFINLGNNDLDPIVLKKLHLNYQDFSKSVEEFQIFLNSNYSKKTKYVYLYGAYINREYIKEFKETILYIKDKFNINVTFIELPLLNHGAYNHPNANEHELIAKIISEKINNNF